jgi:hypothetical protein
MLTNKGENRRQLYHLFAVLNNQVYFVFHTFYGDSMDLY